MEKEFHTSRNEKNTDLPYGWSKGDTCVMITNKAKKSTCEYILESYDGKYFGVRSHNGLYIECLHGGCSGHGRMRLKCCQSRSAAGCRFSKQDRPR